MRTQRQAIVGKSRNWTDTDCHFTGTIEENPHHGHLEYKHQVPPESYPDVQHALAYVWTLLLMFLTFYVYTKYLK